MHVLPEKTGYKIACNPYLNCYKGENTSYTNNL